MNPVDKATAEMLYREQKDFGSNPFTVETTGDGLVRISRADGTWLTSLPLDSWMAIRKECSIMEWFEAKVTI